MTFTPFPWQDLPSTSTPVDKANLQAAEQAIVTYFEGGSSSVSINAVGTDALGRTQILGNNTVTQPAVRHIVSITDAPWSAQGDAKVVTDGSINSGSNVMTSVSAGFTNADVGKIVVFAGAGALTGQSNNNVAGVLIGYIASVSSNTATLVTTKGGSTPSNASTTVNSGGTIKYGTEDTAALGSAIAAVSAAATAQGTAGYGVVIVPGSRSYMIGSVTPKNNVMIWMYGATMHLATSNASSSTTSMMFNPGTTNVSISNFHLRGGTFPGNGSEFGASSSQGIIYWHNYGFGQNGTATYTDISVLDATVTNWSTGVWDIRGGSRLRFERNKVHICGCNGGTNIINCIMGGGASPVNSSDVFIQNNFIDNCVTECIAIGEATSPTGGFDRAIITGNNVQTAGSVNPAAAIDIEWSTVTTGYAHTVIIANNVIRQDGNGSSAWGINAGPTNMPANTNQPNVEDQIIISNNIINSQDGGIACGASDAIIQGNVLNVQNTSNIGIRLAGNTTLSITADLSNSTTLNNVSIAGGGSVSVVNGIQLDGNAGIQNGTYLVSGAGTTTWTISLPATTGSVGQTITGWVPINHVQVINNTIQTGSAIAHNPIFANAIRDSRIHGNIITGVPGTTGTGLALSGILLQRCGWCDIDSNRLSYTPANGIQLDRVNDCLVQRNRIYNTAQSGSAQAAAGILISNVSGNPFRIAQNVIVDDMASHLIKYGVDVSTNTNSLAQLINNEIRGAFTRPSNGVFATGYGNINDVTTDTTLVTTSNATWPIPPGATSLLLTLIGGGGGGGGGGSSNGTTNQCGGGGGAAGTFIQQIVSVGTNTTLNIQIGASASGGNGGSVTGGNGADGTTGNNTTVTGTGISLTAIGGGRGLHSNGNASVTVNGFLWGTGSGGTTTSPGAGAGGTATSTNGIAGGEAQGWTASGGQGGAPASVSTGGVGGAAPGFGTAPVSTSQGTAAGVAGTNGANAPANSGGGGGGGGGGASGSVGGTGGNGGSGYVLVQVLA